MEDYVLDFIPDCIRRVQQDSGETDVSVIGYCFGGVLSLLYAAGHPGLPIRNLAVMATPIDFTKTGPMATLVQQGRLDPEDMIDETGNVPAEAMLNSFKLLKPTQDLVGYVNLWENLWNDEYLVSYQTMTQWGRDQIPFPGATMRQTVELFSRQNALLNDTMRLGNRRVSLSDIRCPFLSVLAEKDHITPPEAVGPLVDLVGSEDKEEMRLPAGHVGLIVGRNASKRTMPAMADWIVRHSGDPIEAGDATVRGSVPSATGAPASADALGG
jgi:polyhydroxyalkanoate synthase